MMSFKLTIGRIAFPSEDVFPNEAIVHIQPHDDGPVTKEYLALWLSSQDLAAGSGRAVKGNTLNGKSLKAIPVVYPPLAVQRRIVDLMEHLDNQVNLLQAEADSGSALITPLFRSLVLGSVTDSEPVPLRRVGKFIRGRRFTKRDYVPSGLGCIHYGQVHTHFGPVTWETLTFVADQMRSRLRLAKPGDVVIAAASEDVAGLGKATVWLGDDEVAVHDDCYIFRHDLDPKFASYLFASSWFQEQKQKFASGTKVTRISGDDLAQIQAPIPDITEQIRIGETMHSLSGEADAVRAESVALKELRASLLDELLSGRADIPDSYSDLLGVAS